MKPPPRSMPVGRRVVITKSWLSFLRGVARVLIQMPPRNVCSGRRIHRATLGRLGLCLFWRGAWKGLPQSGKRNDFGAKLKLLGLSSMNFLTISAA
jgi:hypothetical protein